MRKGTTHFKAIASFLATAIFLSSFAVYFSQLTTKSYASVLPYMPSPTKLLKVSDQFNYPVLCGIKFYPQDPFKFDFVIDKKDSNIADGEIKEEALKLIRYFLSSVAIPEDDLWVNLSPHEENSVIPHELGLTDLGKDMLGEDYVLKQLMASLVYPEEPVGKKFWEKVYARAYELYGTTNIPIDTFNKVWIVPKTAVIYENGNSAFVGKAHLKVMLGEDYVALRRAQDSTQQHSQTPAFGGTSADDRFPPKTGQAPTKDQINNISSQIMREVVLPVIEEEVNQGEHFAILRQIYHSLILATWFKRRLRRSIDSLRGHVPKAQAEGRERYVSPEAKTNILDKIYIDQKKIKGIEGTDPQIKDKIYNQYLEAYKKGVYNYIKRDYDQPSGKHVNRRYFSGGMAMRILSNMEVIEIDENSTESMPVPQAPVGGTFNLLGVGSGGILMSPPPIPPVPPSGTPPGSPSDGPPRGEGVIARVERLLAAGNYEQAKNMAVDKIKTKEIRSKEKIDQWMYKMLGSAQWPCARAIVDEAIGVGIFTKNEIIEWVDELVREKHIDHAHVVMIGAIEKNILPGNDADKEKIKKWISDLTAARHPIDVGLINRAITLANAFNKDEIIVWVNELLAEGRKHEGTSCDIIVAAIEKKILTVEDKSIIIKWLDPLMDQGFIGAIYFIVSAAIEHDVFDNEDVSEAIPKLVGDEDSAKKLITEYFNKKGWLHTGLNQDWAQVLAGEDIEEKLKNHHDQYVEVILTPAGEERTKAAMALREWLYLGGNNSPTPLTKIELDIELLNMYKLPWDDFCEKRARFGDRIYDDPAEVVAELIGGHEFGAEEQKRIRFVESYLGGRSFSGTVERMTAEYIVEGKIKSKAKIFEWIDRLGDNTSVKSLVDAAVKAGIITYADNVRVKAWVNRFLTDRRFVVSSCDILRTAIRAKIITKEDKLKVEEWIDESISPGNSFLVSTAITEAIDGEILVDQDKEKIIKWADQIAGLDYHKEKAGVALMAKVGVEKEIFSKKDIIAWFDRLIAEALWDYASAISQAARSCDLYDRHDALEAIEKLRGDDPSRGDPIVSYFFNKDMWIHTGINETWAQVLGDPKFEEMIQTPHKQFVGYPRDMYRKVITATGEDRLLKAMALREWMFLGGPLSPKSFHEIKIDPVLVDLYRLRWDDFCEKRARFGDRIYDDPAGVVGELIAGHTFPDEQDDQSPPPSAPSSLPPSSDSPVVSEVELPQGGSSAEAKLIVEVDRLIEEENFDDAKRLTIDGIKDGTIKGKTKIRKWVNQLIEKNAITPAKAIAIIAIEAKIFTKDEITEWIDGLLAKGGVDVRVVSPITCTAIKAKILTRDNEAKIVTWVDGLVNIGDRYLAGLIVVAAIEANILTGQNKLKVEEWIDELIKERIRTDIIVAAIKSEILTRDDKPKIIVWIDELVKREDDGEGWGYAFDIAVAAIECNVLDGVDALNVISKFIGSEYEEEVGGLVTKFLDTGKWFHTDVPQDWARVLDYPEIENRLKNHCDQYTKIILTPAGEERTKAAMALREWLFLGGDESSKPIADIKLDIELLNMYKLPWEKFCKQRVRFSDNDIYNRPKEVVAQLVGENAFEGGDNPELIAKIDRLIAQNKHQEARILVVEKIVDWVDKLLVKGTMHHSEAIAIAVIKPGVFTDNDKGKILEWMEQWKENHIRGFRLINISPVIEAKILTRENVSKIMEWIDLLIEKGDCSSAKDVAFAAIEGNIFYTADALGVISKFTHYKKEFEAKQFATEFLDKGRWLHTGLNQDWAQVLIGANIEKRLKDHRDEYIEVILAPAGEERTKAAMALREWLFLGGDERSKLFAEIELDTELLDLYRLRWDDFYYQRARFSNDDIYNNPKKVVTRLVEAYVFESDESQLIIGIDRLITQKRYQEARILAVKRIAAGEIADKEKIVDWVNKLLVKGARAHSEAIAVAAIKIEIFTENDKGKILEWMEQWKENHIGGFCLMSVPPAIEAKILTRDNKTRIIEWVDSLIERRDYCSAKDVTFAAIEGNIFYAADALVILKLVHYKIEFEAKQFATEFLDKGKWFHTDVPQDWAQVLTGANIEEMLKDHRDQYIEVILAPAGEQRTLRAMALREWLYLGGNESPTALSDITLDPILIDFYKLPWEKFCKQRARFGDRIYDDPAGVVGELIAGHTFPDEQDDQSSPPSAPPSLPPPSGPPVVSEAELSQGGSSAEAKLITEIYRLVETREYSEAKDLAVKGIKRGDINNKEKIQELGIWLAKKTRSTSISVDDIYPITVAAVEARIFNQDEIMDWVDEFRKIDDATVASKTALAAVEAGIFNTDEIVKWVYRLTVERRGQGGAIVACHMVEMLIMERKPFNNKEIIEWVDILLDAESLYISTAIVVSAIKAKILTSYDKTKVMEWSMRFSHESLDGKIVTSPIVVAAINEHILTSDDKTTVLELIDKIANASNVLDTLSPIAVAAINEHILTSDDKATVLELIDKIANENDNSDILWPMVAAAINKRILTSDDKAKVVEWINKRLTKNAILIDLPSNEFVLVAKKEELFDSSDVLWLVNKYIEHGQRDQAIEFIIELIKENQWLHTGLNQDWAQVLAGEDIEEMLKGHQDQYAEVILTPAGEERTKAAMVLREWLYLGGDESSKSLAEIALDIELLDLYRLRWGDFCEKRARFGDRVYDEPAGVVEEFAGDHEFEGDGGNPELVAEVDRLIEVGEYEEAKDLTTKLLDTGKWLHTDVSQNWAKVLDDPVVEEMLKHYRDDYVAMILAPSTERLSRAMALKEACYLRSIGQGENPSDIKLSRILAHFYKLPWEEFHKERMRDSNSIYHDPEMWSLDIADKYEYESSQDILGVIAEIDRIVAKENYREARILAVGHIKAGRINDKTKIKFWVDELLAQTGSLHSSTSGNAIAVAAVQADLFTKREIQSWIDELLARSDVESTAGCARDIVVDVIERDIFTQEYKEVIQAWVGIMLDRRDAFGAHGSWGITSAAIEKEIFGAPEVLPIITRLLDYWGDHEAKELITKCFDKNKWLHTDVPQDWAQVLDDSVAEGILKHYHDDYTAMILAPFAERLPRAMALKEACYLRSINQVKDSSQIVLDPILIDFYKLPWEKFCEQRARFGDRIYDEPAGVVGELIAGHTFPDEQDDQSPPPS
ncbi:MAG: hypothetical protein GY858_02555, partial [Candidatus Omnitrophica bacterium]|nr:hypothetical protein [Candidatus Omnitrophota bacterium]